MTTGVVHSSQESQRELRNGDWWLRNTRLLIEIARTGNARTWHGEMGNFVHWIGICGQSPELCEPNVLADFVAEFARLAGSVGEAAVEGESVEQTLDRAIVMAEQRGQPVIPLFRAKAVYHRTRQTESPLRVAALDEALRRVEPGSDDWVAVLVDLSEYYVEVSRYADAVKVLEPIERVRGYGDLQPRQRLGVDVARGVALLTAFQRLRRADFYLARACDVEIDPVADPDAGAWLARGLHYRARMAEANRRFATALNLYLAGLEVQKRLPEDTNALGFVHLRIAELLIGGDLRNSAQHHLKEAEDLFRFGSNVASGRLQCRLGQAVLYASSGRERDARSETVKALAECRRIKYWRGEFLSLCYLLLFDLKRLRVKLTMSNIAALIRTMRRGELRRNNLLLMLRNLPVLLSMALHRVSLLKARPRADERLKPCPCALHAR